MQLVRPNLIMLIFRLAILVFFGYIYQWPLEKWQNDEMHGNEFLFWLGLACYSLFPCYFIWTLLGTMWVVIDKEKGIISFHRILGGADVSVRDIEGYYRSTSKSRIATYKGLLIKLNSGKVIEVTTYNLKSVDSIELFLNENKTPLWGHKDSWFPYTRNI